MAFHSYPHLIQKLFNAYWCGPPSGVTRTSSWTRVDHLVSRLPVTTQRPVKTRFRFGCGTSKPLTLLIPATRRFIMQKARRHSIYEAPTACRRTVSGTFSLLYTRCFSPFPHGTGSLSVSYEYLALADGPAGFTQDFSCPALLRILLCFIWLRIRGYHPLRRNFPVASSHHTSCNHAVLQPHQDRNPDGLGSSPFARHY